VIRFERNLKFLIIISINIEGILLGNH
jgi:hypothetical protein